MEVFEAAHHRGRWKRQSGEGDGPKSVPAPQSTTGQKIREEFNKDVNFVAQKAGVQTYHVIIFIVIVLIAVVGVLAWCVVRFFRKKRRGKDDKADLAADEAALVENEEEDMKVISATNFDNCVLHIYRVSHIEMVETMFFGRIMRLLRPGYVSFLKNG